MNQNLPPNQPGQSGDYSSGQAANPYYTEAPPVDPASLDASAPQLKNTESQKINAKALMFLGGIVVLLILLTILVVMSGGDDEDDSKKATERQQQVVQPVRPSTLDPLDPLAGEPVPAEQLPPMPPPEPIPLQPAPTPSQQNSQASSQQAVPQGPRGPTLAERRMGADESSVAQNPEVAAQLEMVKALKDLNPNAPAQSQPVVAEPKVNRAQFLHKADTLLLRGTYIRCVLETRIVTDVEGFASCIVTEPVYSVNGRSLLLPKGTKVSGKYMGEPTGPRVAVIWDRMTTPTGIDVNMSSPGVDNLGSAGHPGDYDAHWASKISSALFISLMSDAFKYFGEKEGPTSTTVTTGGQVLVQPFESNTARTLDRIANQAVANALRRPATVTINQGTVVNIYVSKDVDFSGVVATKPR